jgi:pyruvate-formate lyase
MMQTMAPSRVYDDLFWAEESATPRVFKLREMYWEGTHLAAMKQRRFEPSGDDSLLGHARDFVRLLGASDPSIQEHELIIGCCLAIPDQAKSLDLGYYNTHYPPGFANVIKRGLAGIRDEARERLGSERDPARREFLEAVALSYDAACDYVALYAGLAYDEAAVTADPQRRQELTRIAEICVELAKAPPSTFYAALQLVQFVRVMGAYGCIGRFDQWVDPLYQRDLGAGRLTPDQAQELIDCLFIKLNYFGDHRGPGADAYLQPRNAHAANNDTLRNIALAGQTADGLDAANEVTRLCLRSVTHLRLPEPKLNVHFFSGSPDWLMEECCEVLATATNVLAIYNDEVAVPALQMLGIPVEDARDYCNDGCEELILGGKSSLRFRVYDALPVLTETVRAGATGELATFADALADYKRRLVEMMSPPDSDREPITFPFFAATIDDCLEKASSSGARYHLWGYILAETANAADGLAAIEQGIYGDSTLTWEELAQALDDDYREHEPLRQRLLNRMPKYGNDDDRADELAREIAEFWCDEVHRRAENPPGPGSKWAPGLMCFGIDRKAQLPASPDGRRQGDPCATSFSPSVGMDKAGPTAALKSVSKVDLTKASHGSVLDLALHSSVVSGSDGLEKLGALVTSFLEMGCSATLQPNIIDRETLLKAQANPNAPEYRKLVVRVWGFSAVFVELPPGLQEHVLARTEHGA